MSVKMATKMAAKMTGITTVLALFALCSFVIASPPDRVSPKEVNAARTDVIVDCHPQRDASQETCEQRGCVWAERPEGEGPWCTFPSEYGYQQSGPVTGTPHGFSFQVYRMTNPSGFYGNDIEELDVEFQFQTNDRLRVLIKDTANQQYRIPKEALDIENPQSSDENRLYEVQWVNEPQFGFRVLRRSTGAIIFDTTTPGFQFSDQYIQFTTRLNSDKVYGFGEHNHQRFRHDMNWKSWGMFTRDMAPVDPVNLYGHQPFYMNIENSNDAHGVVFVNSNAQEVALQPEPYPGISFRTTGGVFDLYIFMGPNPEEVVQQYTEATGRSYMPPYWSLGFQICRWGYDTLDNLKTVVNRNIDAGIPFDVQYGDIDYMAGKLDFTVNLNEFNGLAEYIDELHSKGIKYIVIQDHCIGSDTEYHNNYLEGGYYKAYDEGIKDDIFIRDARDNSYLEGEVWPGKVYYPDFSKPEGHTWWKNQCYDFYYNETWRIEYDALWIDMNEPSNFPMGSTTGCEHNTLNCPPFAPQSLAITDDCLYEKTICMDADTHWGLQYDTHSLYGHSMSISSFNTMRELWPEKRPVVLTRSQFIGSQKYAQHWLGDNQSFWSNIPWSIVGMLEYSLFGFSYTGADICGWFENTDEEMCQRWHQLGAFYPYSRNHNMEEWLDQDPAAPRFSEAFRSNVRDILLERYRLLPFLYTLMHDAHTKGSTVVRPLLHEFTSDATTHDIDTQFMWGASMLISPAMSEGQTIVRAYIPQGRWFDYFTGSEVIGTSQFHDIDTPLENINVHVRGGHILPMQEPAVTTEISRNNPMGILVALDSQYSASGSLFWDDGNSFETFESGDYTLLGFSATQDINSGSVTVTSSIENDGYPGADNLLFDYVVIDGLPSAPTSVLVDGVQHDDFEYNEVNNRLTVRNMARDFNTPFSVQIN